MSLLGKPERMRRLNQGEDYDGDEEYRGVYLVVLVVIPVFETYKDTSIHVRYRVQ